MGCTFAVFCDRQKARVKRHVTGRFFQRKGITQKEDRMMQELMALEDCMELRRGDDDVRFEYRRGIKGV